MALVVVKAVLTSSKPPAVDDSVRTSRCGFGDSAPSLTRASPMHYSAAGGSAILPKLVKLVGPSSSLAEELSSFFTPYAAAPSVRLRVFSTVFASASVARRDC